MFQGWPPPQERSRDLFSGVCHGMDVRFGLDAELRLDEHSNGGAKLPGGIRPNKTNI
jgi:hypothetical protein